MIYCIDKFRTGIFHGLPIYTLASAPDIGKYKIIVTATWENYEQIKVQLKEHDLIEFQDFIWMEAFNKKIAVINANCHGVFYKKYLQQSKTFMRKYVIWDVPQLQLRKTTSISDELLSACDLFIHQDIRVNNSYGYEFSDEYTLSRLKPTCQVVTVPNMVGMGKWAFPTAVRKEYRYRIRGVFWRDTLLDEAYHQHRSIQKIREYISAPNVYPTELITDLFNKCILKLRSREANWDIQISDYILKHYKTEKLFYDEDHAADSVMQEIGRRLCRVLEITDIEGEVDYLMNWEESFIFPCVKEALGLKYEETYIRKSRTVDTVFSEKKMDLDEYIREYVWWFYGDYIE